MGTAWLQESSTRVPACDMARTVRMVYTLACPDASQRGGLSVLRVQGSRWCGMFATITKGVFQMAKFISYGGGVQSTAMIVLAVEGRIPDVDAALFSNVGDDSEHPTTNRYVREVMIPWAAERGFEVRELHRTLKDGSTQTLWQRMMDYEGDKLREPIPVYGWSGAPMSRSCTADHKIKVLGKYVKSVVPKTDWPVDMCIGISVDEIERAGRGKAEPWENRLYPLLDLGLRRSDCVEVIRGAGLPVPPKSSCFFCPFHSLRVWSELRRDDPELFDKAVELENTLNGRRRKRDMPPVYLTRKGKPLVEVVAEAGPTLFDNLDGVFNEGGCDEGYCWV